MLIHIEIRDALIKLFEEPVPESYKAGREVLHSILGSDDIPADKPVLCFSSNPHLSSLAKPGVTPVVWETKGRLTGGCKSVVATIESAGQEQFMDFIGMLITFMVHTVYIPVHTSEFWNFEVHTCTYMYIQGTYFMILELCGTTMCILLNAHYIRLSLGIYSIRSCTYFVSTGTY